MQKTNQTKPVENLAGMACPHCSRSTKLVHVKAKVLCEGCGNYSNFSELVNLGKFRQCQNCLGWEFAGNNCIMRISSTLPFVTGSCEHFKYQKHLKYNEEGCERC